MTKVELIRKLAKELEDFDQLYINGTEGHMSAEFDDTDEEGYLTDDNHIFPFAQSAVRHMLRSVGEYVGHAETEDDYED